MLVLGIVILGGLGFCYALTSDTPVDRRDVVTLVLTVVMIVLVCIGWQNRAGWPGMGLEFKTTLFIWVTSVIVGAVAGTLVGQAYHHKTPAG